MLSFQYQINRYQPALRASAKCIAVHVEGFLWCIAGGFGYAARCARNARQLRLFVLELAGIVLVTFAISLWSLPSAIIVGGLVLVAAVEVRPHVAQTLPQLPVPLALLRAQAEQAARLLNNARFGVAEVDASALEKLSRNDCERIITVARKYEAEAKT